MRRHFLVWLTIVLTVLMTAGASAPAAAHLPIYDSGGSTMEDALEIPDADVSYAIFAEYSSPTERIQFYRFWVEDSHILNFQLSVPAIDDLEDFAPVIILVGPGISLPDSRTSELLSEFSVTLPLGYGAETYEYDGVENEVEFEPFTQINLWIRQEAEVLLPSQGSYYLAVAVQENTTHDATKGFGKYVLAPGKLEEFGILDFILIPMDWLKTQAFVEHNLLVFTLPTILVAVLTPVGTWYYFKKRRPGVLSNLSKNHRIAFILAVTGAAVIMGAAVNQLTLVLGYTSFSPEGADFIVLALQSFGLLIGLAAFGQSCRMTRPRSFYEIILSAILTFAALIVGTGFIIGPVIFLAAGTAELCLGRGLKSGKKTQS